MKIVEAVRLGVLGVARSVAGLAFALSLTAGVAVPASASEDWKEDIISEMKDMAAAGFEKAKASELPGAEIGMAQQLYNTMSATCIGFAYSAKTPTPESIVELSTAIHKDFMRGKVPSDKTIVRLGEQCLNHAEDALLKNGFSQEGVAAFAEGVKESLQHIRKNLGLQEGFIDNTKGAGQ